jgi:hypothetical protein
MHVGDVSGLQWVDLPCAKSTVHDSHVRRDGCVASA